MHFEQTAISGAWVITPEQHTDSRGLFFEWFKAPPFAEAVGHQFDLAQANCSVSGAGTLRGIHFADVPPGQAKYVTCLSGSVLDVVVDLRVGSPTFGRWTATELDAISRRTMYLDVGLGHGLLSLADHSTVVYLCSSTYSPQTERQVDPFDPALAIDWGVDRVGVSMSAKDAAAPSLDQALGAGILPRWQSS